MAVWGGIEAGGTKFVCALGRGPNDVQAQETFATAAPEATIGRAIAFFQRHAPGKALAGVGIASFGPVDPDPTSPRFGYITSTPKPGWAGADFAGAVQRALGVPVSFDTDVNGAALGEQRWGAAQGLTSFVYLTIGTGIGGGGMCHGQLMHGMMHPEMGHMVVPHDRLGDPFAGYCPYHGDCWEGLAAGPAIVQRWGKRGEDLPPDHPAWTLEAHYLALGLVNLITILSPQRIIIGGGLMQQPALFPLVRAKVRQMLNGYIQMPQVGDRIDDYIVPPALGSRAGVLGAIALAQRANRAG